MNRCLSLCLSVFFLFLLFPCLYFAVSLLPLFHPSGSICPSTHRYLSTSALPVTLLLPLNPVINPPTILIPTHPCRHPSIHSSTYPFIHPSIHPSTNHKPTNPSTRLSIHQSHLNPSAHLPINLLLHPSTHSNPFSTHPSSLQPPI